MLCRFRSIPICEGCIIMQHATTDRTASTLFHWVGENNNLDVREYIRLLLGTDSARFKKTIEFVLPKLH